MACKTFACQAAKLQIFRISIDFYACSVFKVFLGKRCREETHREKSTLRCR